MILDYKCPCSGCNGITPNYLDYEWITMVHKWITLDFKWITPNYMDQEWTTYNHLDYKWITLSYFLKKVDYSIDDVTFLKVQTTPVKQAVYQTREMCNIAQTIPLFDRQFSQKYSFLYFHFRAEKKKKKIRRQNNASFHVSLTLFRLTSIDFVFHF